LPALKKGDIVANDVAVKDGKPGFVRVIAGDNLSVLTKRTDKHNFSVELVLAGDVHAPLSADARVGDIIIKEGDRVVGKVPALAADAVEQKTSLWKRHF